MTGLARSLFPTQANGSLVTDEHGQGRRLGADRPGLHQPGLLPAAPVGGGQRLRRHRLVAARTSARPRRSCATASRPTSRACSAENPDAPGPVPAELVTASAQRARPAPLARRRRCWQVPRVARARGVGPSGSARWSRRTSRAATSASSASRGSTCCCSTSRSTGSSAGRAADGASSEAMTRRDAPAARRRTSSSWSSAPSAAGSSSTSASPPASARPTACSRRPTRCASAGVDVVLGFVETHGRAETAALVEGLEVVPRRAIEYRGVDGRGDGSGDFRMVGASGKRASLDNS